MGREKRKGRLNKTGDNASSTGAFIGFGAFANVEGIAGASSVPAPSEGSDTTLSSVTGGSNKALLSPIYTGSDQRLSLLFPKIGQKRDATTKTKALQDLLEFFQSDSSTKKAKAEALSHFLYLFQTKLNYDNASRVRAHAVKVCSFVSSFLPKAWKNLTHEGDAVEIHGMLLCAKADLAAEVRTAAAGYPGDEGSDEKILDAGLWKHAKRILSYHKPVDMHADLFQKKGVGDGVTKTRSSAIQLSESQQEELEERYERIVGTVLEGMRLHFMRISKRQADISQTASSADTSDPASVKYLWKCLASPKASLRRQTYTLLSTVCQLPSTKNSQPNTTKEGLIDHAKMSNLLAQSLAAEKESANLGMLLETILTFVVSFYTTKKERANSMKQHFAKPLTKLFKKGCHAASPATSWTPTILPIVALLPFHGDDPVAIPPKIDLITNVWEGQKHVVTNTDRIEVVSAVAETASFLLAKEENVDEESGVIDPDIQETCHRTLAQCWTRSLQSYLAENGSGSVFGAHRKLGLTLAKGWLQLDKASSKTAAASGKLPSKVYNIREWFWNEALSKSILDKSTKTSNLASLLMSLNNDIPPDSLTTFWASSVLGQKFHSLHSAKPASWVPTHDIYEVWITILKLISNTHDTIFTANNGKDPFEDFIMNKLLSWMILHTSSRSDKHNKDLAILDVTLFHHVCSTPASFAKWWDPLLREVLAGEPDLEILTACLEWLSSKQGGHSIEELVSGATCGFSDFCIAVAQTSISEAQRRAFDDDGDVDVHADKESEVIDHFADSHDSNYFNTGLFLRTCVGLETISEALVGNAVVNVWIESACPIGEVSTTNLVLDTLVAMIRACRITEPAVINRILIQSWRQGGRLWENECQPWLSLAENSTERFNLIKAASNESQTDMQELTMPKQHYFIDEDDEPARLWTERAYRLLQLCSCEQGTNSYAEPPSLSIVGLGDISVWDGKYVDYPLACLMRLIRRMGDASSNWKLFVNSEADTIELFVTVLMGLSQGGEDPLEADVVRRRMDSCAKLLTGIEFESFESGVVHDCIKCCIAKISTSLKGGKINSIKKTCQGIAVLSQLLETRFSSLRPPTKNASSPKKLDPDDVRVGDKIWYITTADDPFTQEPCILVKIHRDLPEEVYFTIRLVRDGVEQERQTLGERLRKHRSSNGENTSNTETEMCIAIDKIDKDEKFSRDKIVGPIVDQLINSIDAKQSPPSFYELYNIAIAQCGLLAGKGIGSLHYSVVQKLVELQTQLLESLSKPENSNIVAPTLWRLAFALGFGMNTPASEWTIPLIGTNATDTLLPLIEYDGDEKSECTNYLNSAMAAWLSVCSPACDDTILRKQSYCLLFDVAARLLRDDNENHYIALRAIEVGQTESHKSNEGESIIQDNEAEALTELTKAFSKRWGKTDEEMVNPNNLESNPLFDSIMRASLSKRPSLMAIASRHCIDALTEALYDPNKQYYVFRILHSYSNAGRPLFEDADDDDLINPTTLDRLDAWAQDMLEVEAEELEDDIASVAQWVCANQMNGVESWHDNYDINDEIACGRMLSWLSFLDIADAATGKESVNRLAFTSYVSICKAVDAMLDLALIYGNVGSNRKVEFDKVVPMEEIIEDSPVISLSKLAARVIFRSVEVFPTLSKNWWDSSCPKYLTTTVREFVEKQVSPDILKIAIDTIQNATAFGEMNVQGGSVTREINATYVQDDFTLSVLIKLPLSFPFRRAEVDCSKTLGVPAHRWKRWSLQITQMLNNQGGTLKDALLLWKENVDKEFDGIEPCPVCYSVLHVKSHKLPNLECKTCHNQFHSDCLHEWFKSSGKSACVICQQPWDGKRIN